MPQELPSQAGDLLRAEQLYQQYLRGDSGNGHVWYLLGAALQQQAKHVEAVAAFEAAVRLNPSLAQAHNHLGVTLAEQGRSEEAVRSFRQAIRRWTQRRKVSASDADSTFLMLVSQTVTRKWRMS